LNLLYESKVKKNYNSDQVNKRYKPSDQVVASEFNNYIRSLKMFNCNWVPVKKGADKICHILVGFIVAIIVTLLTSQPIIGLGAGVTLGIAKELFDYTKKDNKFNFFDMFATFLGTIIGIMCLHLVQSIIL